MSSLHAQLYAALERAEAAAGIAPQLEPTRAPRRRTLPVIHPVTKALDVGPAHDSFRRAWWREQWAGKGKVK